MRTPWGPSQHIERYNDDLIDVSTAGHGGIGVRKDYAETYLSEPARNKAIRTPDWYWYEEDCDWAIPAWELSSGVERKSAPWFFRHSDIPQIKQAGYLVGTLTAWNTQYCFDVGLCNDYELPERFHCPRKYKDFDHPHETLGVNPDTHVYCDCGYQFR